MKGFREQPAASRKERIRELDTELKNMQMALRVSQMLTQQLIQSNKNLSEDMARSVGLIQELQYKCLAIQTVSGLSPAALNEAAAVLRLKDFNEASDAEDNEKGYTVADTVSDNSIVILTSTVEGNPDGGLFRSKISLFEAGPAIQAALIGKKVGDKITVPLNGEEHTIELLAIRQEPEALEVV